MCARLVNVLGSDQWSEEVVPTVAFNLRQVRKGNVTMKVWDVAVSFTRAIYVMNDLAMSSSGRWAVRARWMRLGGMLIGRVNRSSEGCGIGIAEEQMLSCQSLVLLLISCCFLRPPPPAAQKADTSYFRYVVDAADVNHPSI